MSLPHFSFPQSPFGTEPLREESSGSDQKLVDLSFNCVYLQCVAQECQTQPAEPVEVWKCTQQLLLAKDAQWPHKQSRARFSNPLSHITNKIKNLPSDSAECFQHKNDIKIFIGKDPVHLGFFLPLFAENVGFLRPKTNFLGR